MAAIEPGLCGAAPGAHARAMRQAVAASFLAGLLAAGARAPVRVVVTTSMIEAAVQELTAGLPGRVEAVRLLPPGSCPGHFDLAARDLARLAGAKLLLRHDYQAVLDERLAALTVGAPPAQALSVPGTLLAPERFAALAAQVRERLASVLPDEEESLTAALESLRQRTRAMEEETRRRAAAWHGFPVVASVQQRDFCEWLGLRVVGELPRAEDLSPRDAAALQRCGARAVVGNLQSDARAAAALARRLGVPAAILSNFPDCAGYGTTYTELLRHNLEELDRACRTPSPN